MIPGKICKRLALIAVICFAVISCLGCFRIVGTYMIDVDLGKAGESFIADTNSNTLILILPVCGAQLLLLNRPQHWSRICAVVLAVLACLITAVVSPNRNILLYLMGGLIAYRSEPTWLGYVAIVLSILILSLQVILLISRKEPGVR